MLVSRRLLLLLGLVLVAVPTRSAAEDTPSWWLERPEPAEVGSDAPSARKDEPATRSGRRLLALKDKVQSSLTYTAYEHRTRVRPKEGVYVWDCSAMAAWMLRKVAPKARKAMEKGRPVARDFYRMIKRSPSRSSKDGWRRIANIENVRPGDMFAWERPKGFPSKNTGHVGFAIGAPTPVPDWPGAYTLRIVDATSLPHEDDTRSPDGAGIGEGTILFLTDENGRGIGYGWHGNRSRGVILTKIGFARLSG